MVQLAFDQQFYLITIISIHNLILGVSQNNMPISNNHILSKSYHN